MNDQGDQEQFKLHCANRQPMSVRSARVAGVRLLEPGPKQEQTANAAWPEGEKLLEKGEDRDRELGDQQA